MLQVLERIQQQMAEVMASAQEAANSAVTSENQARAISATRERTPTPPSVIGQSFVFSCIVIIIDKKVCYVSITDLLSTHLCSA